MVDKVIMDSEDVMGRKITVELSVEQVCICTAALEAVHEAAVFTDQSAADRIGETLVLLAQSLDRDKAVFLKEQGINEMFPSSGVVH